MQPSVNSYSKQHMVKNVNNACQSFSFTHIKARVNSDTTVLYVYCFFIISGDNKIFSVCNIQLCNTLVVFYGHTTVGIITVAMESVQKRSV